MKIRSFKYNTINKNFSKVYGRRLMKGGGGGMFWLGYLVQLVLTLVLS